MTKGARARFLFLDFDGVLNSLPYLQAWIERNRKWLGKRPAPSHLLYEMEATKIDPLAVERVNRIVKATGAKVVVCSSWRHYHPLPRLRRLLRSRGFSGSVVGVTPAICGAQRGAECAAWLASHPRAAWSFAALDDDNDYEPMMRRLVRTASDDRDGLEDRHVTSAIRLLRSPAREQIASWRERVAKLTAGTVPITPPATLLPHAQARKLVLASYAAHGYSNVVQVTA